QVAKEIGAMASVLKGNVDAIILTGGIAHNTYVVNYIKEMTGFIAPIVVYPGEDEMSALAINGLMVLRNEVNAGIYE
nr:butyrate kinase [Bacteroidales bacterium]